MIEDREHAPHGQPCPRTNPLWHSLCPLARREHDQPDPLKARQLKAAAAYVEGLGDLGRPPRLEPARGGNRGGSDLQQEGWLWVFLGGADPQPRSLTPW
jgi:hypothetical protein